MPPKKDPKAEEVPKEPEPEPLPHEISGYSRFEYLNGILYEGNWHLFKGKKMKHGYGKTVIPTSADLSPETYEGDWRQDQMQGFGTYYYPDGSQYNGEWARNQHHGQGIFDFADGTRYEGQWENHLMHGFGQFRDRLGRKWKGEFRKGRFESRGQSALVKDITISQRNTEIQKDVTALVQKLSALLQSQNIERHKVSPFFGISESCRKFIRGKTIEFEEKSVQDWVSFFSQIKEGKVKVLKSNQESSILASQNILGRQLEGEGQVAELKTEEGKGCACLCVDRGEWVVVAIK